MCQAKAWASLHEHTSSSGSFSRTTNCLLIIGQCETPSIVWSLTKQVQTSTPPHCRIVSPRHICLPAYHTGVTVLDIRDNRLLPPEGGIPYVGHLANDSAGGEENCCLAPVPRSGEETSRIRRHGLYALRDIQVGEQLLYDYGACYLRTYPHT